MTRAEEIARRIRAIKDGEWALTLDEAVDLIAYYGQERAVEAAGDAQTAMEEMGR